MDGTLKALELPGLWNSSMAKWISLFVEVPVQTFSPVKTINDLLRPEHQNECVRRKERGEEAMRKTLYDNKSYLTLPQSSCLIPQSFL